MALGLEMWRIRLLEQPYTGAAKQISLGLAKSKKSITFNMALCLKIRKKWNEFHSNYFWALPPNSRYTEFVSSCFIVYLMIQESFLAPVFSISMLGGHTSRLNGKNYACQEMENIKALHDQTG